MAGGAPDGEGEHAYEVLEAGGTPAQPSGEKKLGVGAGFRGGQREERDKRAAIIEADVGDRERMAVGADAGLLVEGVFWKKGEEVATEMKRVDLMCKGMVSVESHRFCHASETVRSALRIRL